MSRPVWKAALIGATNGLVGCAVLFLASERRTLADDWFLVVMIVFATTTGFAAAAYFELRLIGVAVAGLAGMMVGGWVGVRTIGYYEYTVPTPREDRELRIITPGKERVIELREVPEETVRRVPVGGAVGVLVGWAVGVGVYTTLFRRRAASPADFDAKDERPEPPAGRAP